jgi:Protein of unknown function (DUF4019)
MRKLMIGIAAAAALFAGSASAGPDQQKETAASAAAASWLALVDAGKYVDSWKEAASLFKDHMAQQQWEDALSKVRKPQGDLVSRKPKSATHKTSLPGTPDGDYFVLQFDTSYAKLPSAVETVTMMLDKDGSWRTVGYRIK